MCVCVRMCVRVQFHISMYRGAVLMCTYINTYFTIISVLLLYLLWGLSVLTVESEILKRVLEIKINQKTKI